MPYKAISKSATIRVNVVIPLNSGVVDQDVFIADRKYQVLRVDESHAVLGTDAGAVTLDVKKCTGTTAAASGTTVLASTFNLKSTVNTVVSKTKANGGVVSTPVAVLAEGDRLAFDITGVTTAVAGMVVTLVLQPLN